MLIDELSKNMQARKQTGLILPDFIMLDFSKAFDKVAHEKLLQIPHTYDIRGETLKWIKDFLYTCIRKQSVVTNGANPSTIPVSSGVKQGSVLGPILFLAYINDLPEQVRSRVRLFADDTAMYLCIGSLSEPNILQEDLRKLEQWEEDLDMNFNCDLTSPSGVRM